MKKRKIDLIGKIAIVHPLVTTDPLNKHGETGTIVSYNSEEDIAALVFNDGQTGLYNGDTLLVLRPKKALLKGYAKEHHLLGTVEGIVALYVIKKMMQKNHADALVLALKYDRIAGFATISCQQLLEQDVRLKSCLKPKNR